jgi:hypothetical protein
VTIVELTPAGATSGGDSERSRVRALVRASLPTADVATLTRLCEVTVDELRLSGAVVSLMTPAAAGRPQSGTLVASSSDRARAVDELEFSLGEGPAQEAFATSRMVLTPDLEAALIRWPGYVPAALAAGVRATFAFPLLVGAARFGVLHLHSDGTRTLTVQETSTGLVLTELATEVVLDTFAPVGAPAGSDAPLLGPGNRRAEIYQAQGMVMVHLGVGPEEALARMRAHAFATDQDLADLAADILAGRTRLHDQDEAP